MPERSGTIPGQENSIRNSILTTRNLKNNENEENPQFTEKLGKLMLWPPPSTLKLHFRSADAANHVNRDPREDPGVTHRAYIPKICKLKE